MKMNPVYRPAIGLFMIGMVLALMSMTLLANTRILNKKAAWLDVILADGRTLQVYEPFDEFLERIRRSQ